MAPLHLYQKMQGVRVNPTTSKFQDFPDGSVVKNLPTNARDVGLIPELGGSHMPLSLSATTIEPAL